MDSFIIPTSYGSFIYQTEVIHICHMGAGLVFYSSRQRA